MSEPIKNTQDFPRIIEINEDFLVRNEELYTIYKQELIKRKIRMIEVVGAIGAGKTAILEKLVEKLTKEYHLRVFVICGDVITTVDSDRIEKRGARVSQINTGKECALNAYHINRVLTNIDLDSVDVIFVENVGNLICPSDFLLGADVRIMVVSITEGPWVIRKHPLLAKQADIILINKMDLNHILKVDVDSMVADAKAINGKSIIMPFSANDDSQISILIEKLGFSK